VTQYVVGMDRFFKPGHVEFFIAAGATYCFIHHEAWLASVMTSHSSPTAFRTARSRRASSDTWGRPTLIFAPPNPFSFA